MRVIEADNAAMPDEFLTNPHMIVFDGACIYYEDQGIIEVTRIVVEWPRPNLPRSGFGRGRLGPRVLAV